MKILVVEPGKNPVKADIPNDLYAMQKVVGGYIEIVCPFDDPVALVCDEEGKLKGYEMNCLINHDVIVGTFFLAGDGDDDLCDLPDFLADKYAAMFAIR